MRVLMLAPWPVVRFLHGGQLRAAAIVRAYQARGHAVRLVGQHDPRRTGPDDAGPHDYAVPADLIRYVAPAEMESKLGHWRALARMPHALDSFAAQAAEVRPDLLQFEEPYLWPLVGALRERGALDGVPVLHSSYNFETEAEAEMKACGAAVTSRTLADVADLERDVARGADAVVVVSERDAASFRALGARRVTVASNGASRPPADAEADEALDGYLQGEAFALFVSSAHLPNVQGLLDMTEGARPFVLRRGSLLVCGGAAGALRAMRAFADNQHVFRRARLLGAVSEPLLGALYRRARVVALPKTRGGGSNLKTAEALISGRPVVATSRAFEGFERHARAPGVFIEDDPPAFWRRIQAALDAPDQSPARDPALLEELLWERCLEPMVDLAETLAGGARVDPAW